jgi:phosphoribosylanthranilate isomerase
MIRTKICGITSIEDLQIAQNSGTDAVGFLVGKRHNAKGFISIELAKELCIKAQPFINTVVVTHLEKYDEIINLAKKVNSNTIQLHSDLDIQTIIKLKQDLKCQKIICKVSILDYTAIQKAIDLEEYADAILLDSIDIENDKVGGTGKVHNWEISKLIVEKISKPVILAGGLTPKNIEDAIITVKPWGVDVNTGVTTNYIKNKELIESFVLKAKNCH